MKIEFNSEQLIILNKLSLDFDLKSDLSDDNLEVLDEKVSNYFSSNCIGFGDKISQEGLICESIMDILGNL